MRYVSSIQPAAGYIDQRGVKRLDRTRAVSPVSAGEGGVAVSVRQHPHEPRVAELIRQVHRELMEERRKACRRVSHQPALIDLRSGADRRHHNLREGDVVEHIDEEA